MATRDLFLDALAPVARSPVPMAPPAAPPRPPVVPPTRQAPPADSNQPALKEPRPDFADDIDRIVAEMVTRGDVVFDATLGAYRAPHCRRWRFGDVS